MKLRKTASLLIAVLSVGLLQMVSACALANAQMNLTPYSHQLAITPHPQEVFTPAGATGTFTINEGTWIRVLHDEDLPGAELLVGDVERRAGITISAHKDTTVMPAAHRNVIYITRSTDNVQLGFPKSLFPQLDVANAEGYSLIIQNNRALIRAADARGAIYGVQTLRQLLRHDLSLPNLAIRDWPEMPKRQVYGLYNGEFRTRADIDRYVDRALLLKYNAIVFESIWNYHENWWFNFTDDRKAWAMYFKEAAEKHHIEFIPLIQGPGWGYGITDQAPMLSTGVWIEKEKQKLAYAAPTPLVQRNVVTNESAPIVVTDLTGAVQYQKDKDFKVLPGRTARPYAPENAPWQLQAIEGGAIADGQEILVSYNAVTKPHAHHSWNISDPEAFRILDFTLDRVQNEMNPPSIHIGHDEVWQLGTDSRDLQSGLTQEQLVEREVLHWYNRIKKNNPETTIYMWDDLLRPGRSGVSYGILTENIEAIPKDIVVVPWYYYARETSAATIRNRLEHLTKNGFSVIGAPSGYFRDNSWFWYQELRPYIQDGRAQGMLFTVWDALHRGDMVAAGELMWSGQTVDRERYQILDALTERMKAQGLVFTLSPRVQMGAYAGVVSKGLKEQKTPDQIIAEFRTNVIGDTSVFEKALGAQAWSTLGRDVIFPEQELGNLVRVPLFLQTMTDYLKADAAKDRQMLQSVINTLHELNHFSFKERNELIDKSRNEWVTFKELFGVEQPFAA